MHNEKCTHWYEGHHFDKLMETNDGSYQLSTRDDVLKQL